MATPSDIDDHPLYVETKRFTSSRARFRKPLARYHSVRRNIGRTIVWGVTFRRRSFASAPRSVYSLLFSGGRRTPLNSVSLGGVPTVIEGRDAATSRRRHSSGVPCRSREDAMVVRRTASTTRCRGELWKTCEVPTDWLPRHVTSQSRVELNHLFETSCQVPL
jgi:hypothetical protein